MPVAQRGLQRCLRLGAHGRVQHRFHSSAPSPTASPLSVAKLLATPADDGERQVYGFVRSIRKQKTRAFAAIGDGSSLEPLQALLTPAQAESLTTGAAVHLTGQWTASPAKATQASELHVNAVDLLGASDAATYPLQKKFQTVEYLRTLPHLRARLPANALLLRLRSHAIAHLTTFFAAREFTQTHPPILTSSDCEGAGEVFGISTAAESPSDAFASATGGEAAAAAGSAAVPFFRTPKYLTVSSQLHLEALAQAVGGVWTLSPTFRAERSDTARHLSEFYMLEAEATFVSSLDAVMDLAEDMIRSVTRGLNDSTIGEEVLRGQRREGEEGIDLEGRWKGILEGPWPRITYTQAIDALVASGETFEHVPVWGAGLQAEHERFLAREVGKGGPVFVTKYPAEIKPFYMLPSSFPGDGEDRQTVDCFDLLLPDVCEVAGGSLREHSLEPLQAAMRKHGVAEEGMEWYTDLRRWGSVPHGGFGVGFDRLLAYLGGVGNIREVVAFPRWVGRCEC
ncbi:asparaginyl-tRNA synthetase [Pseudogymnoascus sp. WSF 3629]|nr:asparaginyl-tRNA synthetase [Pseudogymnoascus sp. WSF 3629]